MWRLIAHRLLMLPVLIVGISIVVFVTVRLIPGDPAQILAGGIYATPGEVERVRQEYRLDRPLLEQYATFAGNLARGDMGESLFSHRPVTDELRDRLPASIELSFYALLLGAPLGFAIGLIGALRRDTRVDYAFTASSLIGLSIPSFILGLFLAWLFAVRLQWLPLSGRLSAFAAVPQVTGITTLDALVTGTFSAIPDAFKHLVLPVVTVAVIPLAVLARYTRAMFIEILGQDYIRTARAYGIPEGRLLFVYAAKNAMLPLVTLMGILVPAILVGTVLVETVFAWPGIGTLLLQAITSRDYPVVQGVTLVFALMYVLINLAIDISYLYLDPRTRGR